MGYVGSCFLFNSGGCGLFGTLRNYSEEQMAGGLGFEPRLAESESAVLPLDDPPKEARKLNSDLRAHKGRIADHIC